MTDHVEPETRSKLMAAVGSKNTKPEVALRRSLHRLGYRFRLHRKDLPGRPDLVFPSRRKIIFVHGCFWHRHSNCRYASTPKSNVEFWENKFRTNVDRDRRAIERLRELGWDVLVVWECEIKKLNENLTRIADFLNR